MSRKQTPIDAAADSWLEQIVAMSPMLATYIGYPQGASKLDDFSPEMNRARSEAASKTISKLQTLEAQDLVDRVTQADLQRELELSIAIEESGLNNRDLNVIASPAQGIRDIFDISPTATAIDWENLASRMSLVARALESYTASLRRSIAANDAPAKRQVESVIEQVNQITAQGGFFESFAAGAKAESGELPEALRAELKKAAEEATQGYAAFGRFLIEELLPKASERDAIGRERYELLSKSFLGTRVDLDETYEWGIEELNRIVREQESVANEIVPGGSIQDAIAALEADPKRKLHGTTALQSWMQKLSDEAIAALQDVHFDIPEPMRRLECMIAPTQHGGIYYTGPSDDFSRPGRMWWSVPKGVTEFDTWRETTTVYHEGVPGHHLQIAQAVHNRSDLNSWRRLVAGTSGHSEGWALYAERLMEELGFLDDPADRLGMLDGQRMRAARVVLDIGVHLEKPKLKGSGIWDFDYALQFMTENMNMPQEFVRFEVNRYFGWPAQAPSYKIGQRVWEGLRSEFLANNPGPDALKDFHRLALAQGGLGLDSLRVALS